MTSNQKRRRLLQWLAATTGLGLVTQGARSETKDPELFGEPAHKVVYQFNKADIDYMESILFSIGAMLRKHTDDIHVVVTAIGPGIHILAKRPRRPVPELIRQRVSSLAAYGVSFHACGNTLRSLEWGRNDLVDFAEIVDVGADDLMTLQEQGYSYISW
ncbi:MAG: DsrE family protein [Gammaproteobacteria bacterium]|jgi:intracellular sulfur oxidation DsrE/DsrF family protein